MKELGFTPNLNARRLVNGRSYVMALCHVDQEAAADLFTLQVAREIVGPLKSLGFDLWLNLAPDSAQEHALLRQMIKSRTVDGLILVCEQIIPRKFLRELSNNKRWSVVISHVPVEGMPFIGSVVMNLRTGVQEAAQLLVQNGHRRIGFIDSDLRDEVSVLFAEALAELGVKFELRNYITAEGRNVEDGSKALETLMSQHEPPTAVLARTDILAIGALRAARRMGLSVPGDLSVIGHDDLSFLTLAEPGLTTIRIDCTGLAEIATRILSDLLIDPNADLAPGIIDTSLIVRQTVGHV